MYPMRTAKKNKGKSNLYDRFQTPAYAILPLLPYIGSNQSVWEPACGVGNLVNSFISHGFLRVIGTDILTGDDFFGCVPKDEEIIVTNPPYSLKIEWIRRCYELGKPFALLLPMTVMEQAVCKMFDAHGIELIIPYQRINFETPSGEGSGAWFKTAWFTWRLNIGKQLTFVDLSKPKKEYELEKKKMLYETSL